MNLKMDLIREILLWCEENTPDRGKSYRTSDIEIPGFTSEQIVFHFKLLIDSGYIDAIDSSSGVSWKYFINHLTMEGYEFLESMKSDTVWNGMKEAAQSMGIQAIKLAFPIIVQLLAKQAGLN